MYNEKHPILIGHTTGNVVEPLSIVLRADEFKWHLDKRWFSDHMFLDWDIDIDQTPGEYNIDEVIVDADILRKSAIIVGAQGSGKTTVSLNILHEQLKAGASVVVIDTKDETIQQCLAVAEKAGLAHHQITVVWPRERRNGIPGWNPLAEQDNLERAVADFLSVVLEEGEGGVTYGPILQRGAMIVGSLNLSIQELLWFFREPDYRKALLTRVRTNPSLSHLMRHVEYFETEFEATYKKVAPDSVLNKLGRLMVSSDFDAMLGAERDTLHIADLWHEQRILLVHLDFPNESENRVFSNIITRQLKRQASRQGTTWERPVILLLDELRYHAKLIGDLITDIQSVGRSQGLWLLAATQSLDLIPEQIKKGLTSLTGLKIFMHLSHDEAQGISRYLKTENSYPTKIELKLRKHGKEYETLHEELFLYSTVDDRNYETVFLDNSDFRDLGPFTSSDPLSFEGVERLRHTCGPTATLAVELETGTYITFDELCKNVTTWELVKNDGYRHLRVNFTYPRPDVKILESSGSDIARNLDMLPDYQGYVRTNTKDYGLVETIDFSLPCPLPDPRTYLDNGQSEDEIREVAEERRAAKERMMDPEAIAEEEAAAAAAAEEAEEEGYEDLSHIERKLFMDRTDEEEDRLALQLRKKIAYETYKGHMPVKQDGTLWFPDTPACRLMLVDYAMEPINQRPTRMWSSRDLALFDIERNKTKLQQEGLYEQKRQEAMQLSDEIEVDRGIVKNLLSWFPDPEIAQYSQMSQQWFDWEQRKLEEFDRAYAEWKRRPKTQRRPRTQYLASPVPEDPAKPSESPTEEQPPVQQNEALPDKKDQKADDRGYL